MGVIESWSGAAPLAMAAAAGNSALITFGLYMLGVFALAVMANRRQAGAEFAGEYFLGSKNFGMWAFALTYAATAASGGSFMGFPSFIYSSGWALAWWIGGYAVVPLVALGLFAKRINQVGRIAGAITVPELLRRRFDSTPVGNVATLLLILFMFFVLLAQFKAGAEIMTTLMDGVPAFQSATRAVEGVTRGLPWVGQASGDYLLCLLVFAFATIIYTTYGGFRAVVWTDVMQGLVMAVGVLLLLTLTLRQVGGMESATRELARMTPPEFGEARLVSAERMDLPRGSWVATAGGDMLRLADAASLEAGGDGRVARVLRLTTATDADRVRGLAQAGVEAELLGTEPYAYGAGQQGVYVTAPGPSKSKPSGFLTVLLAMSFFAFWNFSGAGQPSYMVRQMSFDNTVTLRRSIILVAVFFSIIYFPLVVIFTSARVLLPGMEVFPDRVMPEMAAHVTTVAGYPWLAGLLVAAPFAAVMSSVDSFLILVSSGVVRDIYQQNINPHASEAVVKRLSYLVTLVVGVLGVLAVLNPPRFLQDLIVFGTGGLGACFLMPMALAMYWRRMTAAGAVAGMIGGAGTILALYTIGYFKLGEFGEFNLLGLHPFIWAVMITSTLIVTVSLRGRPPRETVVERYFGKA
jgi:sodium/pantothenate symporter